MSNALAKIFSAIMVAALAAFIIAAALWLSLVIVLFVLSSL